MRVSTTERRSSGRISTAYPAKIRSRNGKILARGRTSNVSAHGAFLIADREFEIPSDGVVVLELVKPDLGRTTADDEPNLDRYECCITRSESLGQLTGLAVKFNKKMT